MILVRLSVLACLSLLGCGSVGTVCGCDDSCEATRSCTPTTGTEAPPPECPDDPADGDVRGDCGIWVSATLGSDDAPGTQAEPVRTLQRGVDLAGPSGRVYACAQTYEQPVAIPAGVSLHGGWSCADGWEPSADRATIAPDHEGIPLRLVAGDGESLITDIVARAKDAGTPGASSIAALADVGAAAELRRVELRAGNGADGADGENGGPQPATSGAAGTSGDGACSMDVGAGGLAPVTTCDDGVTSGGEGGAGGDTGLALSGGDGVPDLGAGKGGQGEDLSPTCTPGTDGAAGMPGEDGLGAAAGGTLAASGYVVASGMPGTAGTRAQGGGGGGASYGGAGCGLLPKGGAGGGSGGAGGCGGKPGLGGQGGGASIAFASRSSGIKFAGARLVAKAGGAGGNGGAGQVGGLGGLPGLGGAFYPGQPPVSGACAGGFGGSGGIGGNGGGGAGGPSAAIAHLFGAAPATEDVELVVGTGGAGGLGGNPMGGAGDDGAAAKVLGL